MTARPYAEVIGDPIDHSLSPSIHGFWLEALGIDAEYRRRRVQRGELQAYLATRRDDRHWRGCNVTMPLKLDVIALADEASDRALGTGAANVLFRRDGRLLAGNTDVAGIMVVVDRLLREGEAAGTVTVLGSGGAARAALMALHLLGAASVRIQARNRAAATRLAVQFRLGEPALPFDSPVAGDALINATPLGMKGMPQLDLSLDKMAANGWVLDFVTAPTPTKLLRRAGERGLRTADGISVLVEQADDSFRLFFGADPPREADEQLFARLRR